MNDTGRTRARPWLRIGMCLAIGALAYSWIPIVHAEDAVAEAERPVKLIKMTAENWRWIPDLIRVPVGTRLRLEIRSYDASHSFLLKSHRIKTLLPEGTTNIVEFDVDKAGTFRWKCGRPCGNGCAKMRGKLIVEEPPDAE